MSEKPVTFIMTYYHADNKHSYGVSTSAYIIARNQFKDMCTGYREDDRDVIKWGTMVRATDGTIVMTYTQTNGFITKLEYDDDISTSEIERVVNIIENEIYDQTNGCEYFNVCLKTNGNVHIIDFIGIQIWSSDDDERKYVLDDAGEETEELESLETFLRRTIQHEIFKLVDILLVAQKKTKIYNPDTKDALDITINELDSDLNYYMAWKKFMSAIMFDSFKANEFPCDMDSVHRACDEGAALIIAGLKKLSL